MKRIVLALIVVAFSCHKEEAEPVATKGEAYLDELIDVMQENSIRKKEINWDNFRTVAHMRTNNPVTIEDVDIAIAAAIKALGDHHSFYQRGTSVFFSGFDLACTGSSTVPAKERLPNVGYVKVGSFSGTAAQADSFSAAIRTSIIEQDNVDLVGWIVDLRGNSGGNMWPMVSGVGPILGDGTAGYFIYPDESSFSWGYSDGSSVTSGNVAHTATIMYTLKKPNPKVAVLIDNRTASSGEATLISFIGRPNTRIFGQNSCGLSTSNQGFKLSDGAYLYLTTAVLADRNKVKQGGQVAPDETVFGDTEVVDRAVAWLSN